MVQSLAVYLALVRVAPGPRLIRRCNARRIMFRCRPQNTRRPHIAAYYQIKRASGKSCCRALNDPCPYITSPRHRPLVSLSQLINERRLCNTTMCAAANDSCCFFLFFSLLLRPYSEIIIYCCPLRRRQRVLTACGCQVKIVGGRIVTRSQPPSVLTAHLFVWVPNFALPQFPLPYRCLNEPIFQ